jgi:hypothetical protein
MQVVGLAVCKFEHQGFERAKERWDRAKDKLRAKWDSASLRREFLSKVLKNCKE